MVVAHIVAGKKKKEYGVRLKLHSLGAKVEQCVIRAIAGDARIENVPFIAQRLIDAMSPSLLERNLLAFGEGVAEEEQSLLAGRLLVRIVDGSHQSLVIDDDRRFYSWRDVPASGVGTMRPTGFGIESSEERALQPEHANETFRDQEHHRDGSNQDQDRWNDPARVHARSTGRQRQANRLMSGGGPWLRRLGRWRA